MDDAILGRGEDNIGPGQDRNAVNFLGSLAAESLDEVGLCSPERRLDDVMEKIAVVIVNGFSARRS